MDFGIVFEIFPLIDDISYHREISEAFIDEV